MEWIGIAGARRIQYDQVEIDVRKNVTKIFQEGNGVISGGALGVDYIAADEALKHDLTGRRIKIIIPSNLQTYQAYFNNRASQGVIESGDVDMLMEQLKEIQSRNPASLIELKHTSVYRKTFHARNEEVIKASDELQAYQVRESTGTKNAVQTARQLGKPVKIYDYPVLTQTL